MNTANLAEATAALHEGRCVIHPTETCYGIACDLTNLAAVERMFALKQRPGNKPVSGLFPSVDAAKTYVRWNAEAQALAAEGLPGPLTIIVPMRDDAPAKLYPAPVMTTQSLGVRVSSHPVAMELARAYPVPVSTTSANIHGKPNPYSLDDIRAQFGDDALRDVVLLDGGMLPENPPSKVVDLTSGGRILRG